jgi:hypothetical protein
MSPITSRLMTGTPEETYSAAVGEMSSKSRAMPSTMPAPNRTWITVSAGSQILRLASCQRTIVR